MKLSLYTDYSLRVLMYLGANPSRRVTLTQLGEYYGISVDHLRKIVHELGRHDYIKTYRGKNGGFELNIPSGEINIGELVATTEGRKPVVDCQKQPCVLASNCRLQGVLAKAEEAFFDSLNQYSLADILEDKKMVRNLMSG